MQLGTILDSARHKPAVVHPVKFRVAAKNAQMQTTHVDAEAVLVFVDEDEREASLATAADYVAKRHKGNPPAVVEGNERAIHFLAIALRDKSDPAKPFADSVEQLRLALVFAVAEQLSVAYEEFVAREFPSSPSDEDAAKMRDEAAGK